MKPVLQRFDSFAEAENAERAHYASLTPQERLDLLLELMARWRESLDEAAEGFERIYRVTELPRR